MKTIKEIVSNEWYKVTSLPFGDMEAEHMKWVLKAVKEASEQAFNAAREEDIEFMAYREPKYVNAQDYINQIDK